MLNLTNAIFSLWKASPNNLRKKLKLSCSFFIYSFWKPITLILLFVKNSPPFVSRLLRKCGSLDVSQTFGPLRLSTGLALLPFVLYINCRKLQITLGWHNITASLISELGQRVQRVRGAETARLFENLNSIVRKGKFYKVKQVKLFL
jgi:hypothetical protein